MKEMFYLYLIFFINYVTSLLLLVIAALQHVQWPSDPAKRQTMFNLSEKTTVKKLLLQMINYVLLMPYGYVLISI